MADGRASEAALLTFGHGTATEDEIVALLRGAGVASVVDVRRFPGSRAHPHVARDELARWLPDAGVAYRWEPRLGGRRARSAEAGERDAWWQVAAFRAYAAHTRTAEFAAALDELVAEARARRTAVLCSESLWWRCHRRIVADAVVLLGGLAVAHLGHDGRLVPHVPSAGARVAPDGLEYPADAGPEVPPAEAP
jgi:uncharacterized protein (DUF488 family)